MKQGGTSRKPLHFITTYKVPQYKGNTRNKKNQRTAKVELIQWKISKFKLNVA